MDSPERITGVSVSMFSVARYYGGIVFNGEEYRYDYATDTLIRLDVWKRENKRVKNKKVQEEKIGDLFDNYR